MNLYPTTSAICISRYFNLNLLEVIQIFKGDAQIPKWLSSGAKNLIRRILDPNPRTRITMAEIKEDAWFKQDYTPANPEEDEGYSFIDDEAFLIHEVLYYLMLIVAYIASLSSYYVQFRTRTNGQMLFIWFSHLKQKKIQIRPPL